MKRRIAAVAALLVIAAVEAAAHELRPAYLDLLETAPGEFAVLWKTPMAADARLALTPEFSGAHTESEITTRVRGGAALQEWTLRTSKLRGESIRIVGLEGTMTDALVRISFIDGSNCSLLLTPRAPSATIPVAGEEFAQLSKKRPALPDMLGAWAVVCAAAAIARARVGGRWHGLIASASYLAGAAAVFLICQSIAEIWLRA